MKITKIQTFSILVTILFFIIGCEKSDTALNVSSEVEEYLHLSFEKPLDSDSLYHLKANKLLDKGARTASSSLKTCNAYLPSWADAIIWEYYCNINTPGGIQIACPNTSIQYPAKTILENYINCKLPERMGRDEYVCQETTILARYAEGGVATTCSSVAGYTNPWQYLDFASNCSVTPSQISATLDKLEDLGDFIIYTGLLALPSSTPLQRWVLSIEIEWTAWDECLFSQQYYNCEFEAGNTAYPCGAAFWNGTPECSLCKDICEYRELLVRFNYTKLCKSAQDE